MKTLPLSLALCIAAAQTGCVMISNPSYPEAWAPVEKQFDICTTLPGNFGNSGEPARAGEKAPPLASLLFKEAKSATNVRIERRGESSFVLIAEASGKALVSRTIEGKCGEHRLRVLPEVPEGFVNREGVVGYQHDSVELEVSVNSGLVVRYTTGGFGIMLLIPAGGFESRWYQYPRVRTGP